MSKKKSLTTMTLKDFHGGSIPSELPLPSAPGVSPRPPDRAAAGAASRPDHLRSRGAASGSAAAAAAAAAAPAFLTHPSRIGRHFDEDERTPFEAAAPRRAAPSVTPSPSPAPAPVVVARSDLRAPFPAVAAGGSGNAWAPRAPPAPAPAAGGGQIWSPTRIAKASAVEKVISGKWHSKPSSPPPLEDAPDSPAVAPPPEMERPRSVGYPGLSSGAREMEAVERGAPPVRPASHEGRVGERRVEEAPERPKLKLLPRTKPIDASEPTPLAVVEEKQVLEVRANVVQVETVHVHDMHVGVAKTSVAGADAESRAAERPRLNLKPRSHITGQSEESAARERWLWCRQTLFGGARPRELVLKERGIDVAATDLEKTSPVGRAKNELAKIESKAESGSLNPSSEKVEISPSGQRGPGNVDRKDYRRDADRVDAHKPLRRDDNRRAARDVEKPPEQLRPEPETWRKPVEPPKPEVPGPRFGKAATALELAQAFSKSVSDTVPQSRLTSIPNQRVAPSPAGREQVGFSRLTDNRTLRSGPAQRKINGY